jgi:hypothetical protein
VDVRLERLEPGETQEPQVPQDHAHEEFPQHRRLAEAHGEIPAELGAEQDDGEADHHTGHGIAVARALGGRVDRPGGEKGERRQESFHEILAGNR